MGKNKRILKKKHTGPNKVFSQQLMRLKTQYFMPKPSSKLAAGQSEYISSLVQSIHYLKDGRTDFFSTKKTDFLTVFPNDITKKTFINEEILQKLSDLYEVTIRVFYERVIIGGRQIDILKEYGRQGQPYPEIIGVLKSTYDHNYYAAILPKPDGSIDFITTKIYCNSHGDWVNISSKKEWDDHLKDCVKCKCGRQYYKSSGKHSNCDGLHYEKDAKKKYKGRVKRYQNETNIQDPTRNYFCDLETFPDMQQDGSYIPYAGGYAIDTRADNNAKLFIGPRAMEEMMMSIFEECNGVFWFFNGAKFDNFFVLRWILENEPWAKEKGYFIEDGSVIKIGNSILSMTFTTKKGKVVLKDLAKFLPGSLRDNCKAFNVPPEYTKGDLDHEKMTNWDVIKEDQENICKYLYNDIISLKYIYMNFADEMFNEYKQHPSNFVTLTQMAYAAFSTTLKGPGSTLWKTPLKDEKKMRKMYKGGRVICGRPHWKSSWWKRIKREKIRCEQIEPTKEDSLEDPTSVFKFTGHKVSRKLYDMIDDHLVWVDANSLYPSVQVDRKYPTGKHNFQVFENPGSPEEKDLIKRLNTRYKAFKTTDPIGKKFYQKHKDEVERSSYQVDIDCPKDLTIAFLMTKNDKGGVEQNLFPKVKSWFTGPEIWEATKLGYTIKRIYQVCRWETSSDIFTEYVRKTYELKKNSPKDTPKYTCAKNMLNGLTGKFAQHLIATSTHIYLANQEITRDCQDITEIYNKVGDLLGWFVTCAEENEYCGFPIHLSAFILGWSRVYMSKILRKMKVENSCEYCPCYGDTDSLIIHKKAWDILPEKFKGESELGQLKYEKAGKVIEIMVLAPKTYTITYIDEKTLQICSITKSKGIPHNTMPYNTFELYINDTIERIRGENEFDFLERKKKQKESKEKGEERLKYSENVKIGSRNYLFHDNTEFFNYSCSRIPRKFVKHVLYQKKTMDCVYGGMVRKFEPGNIGNISITPMSSRRRFARTDWWGTGVRPISIRDKSENDYPTGLPLGHYRLEEEYNKNYLL